MKKLIGVGISVFCLTLAGTFLYPLGCSETQPVQKSVQANPAPPTGEAGQAGFLIQISAGAQDLGAAAFGQNPLTITQGTAVTWENTDTVEHIITSDNAVWNPLTMMPGEIGTFTFSDLGNFPYHCSLHPSMTGTIQVVAPSDGT